MKQLNDRNILDDRNWSKTPHVNKKFRLFTDIVFTAQFLCPSKLRYTKIPLFLLNSQNLLDFICIISCLIQKSLRKMIEKYFSSTSLSVVKRLSTNAIQILWIVKTRKPK